MAYSPAEQGRILGNPVLRDIAARLDASPVQVALAWVLRLDNICAIPRSGHPEHVYENRAALAIHLDRDALAALDAEFPAAAARPAAGSALGGGPERPVVSRGMWTAAPLGQPRIVRTAV